MHYEKLPRELQHFIDAHILLMQLDNPPGNEHRGPLFDDNLLEKERAYWAQAACVRIFDLPLLQKYIEAGVAHHHISMRNPIASAAKLREQPQSKRGQLLDEQFGAEGSMIRREKWESLMQNAKSIPRVNWSCRKTSALVHNVYEELEKSLFGLGFGCLSAWRILTGREEDKNIHEGVPVPDKMDPAIRWTHRRLSATEHRGQGRE